MSRRVYSDTNMSVPRASFRPLIVRLPGSAADHSVGFPPRSPTGAANTGPESRPQEKRKAPPPFAPKLRENPRRAVRMARAASAASSASRPEALGAPQKACREPPGRRPPPRRASAHRTRRVSARFRNSAAFVGLPTPQGGKEAGQSAYRHVAFRYSPLRLVPSRSAPSAAFPDENAGIPRFGAAPGGAGLAPGTSRAPTLPRRHRRRLFCGAPGALFRNRIRPPISGTESSPAARTVRMRPRTGRPAGDRSLRNPAHPDRRDSPGRTGRTPGRAIPASAPRPPRVRTAPRGLPGPRAGPPDPGSPFEVPGRNRRSRSPRPKSAPAPAHPAVSPGVPGSSGPFRRDIRAAPAPRIPKPAAEPYPPPIPPHVSNTPGGTEAGRPPRESRGRKRRRPVRIYRDIPAPIENSRPERPGSMSSGPRTPGPSG
jgi:hypothetical protein